MVDVTQSSAPQHSLMNCVSIHWPVRRFNGAALTTNTPRTTLVDDELDENYIRYREELLSQDYALSRLLNGSILTIRLVSFPGSRPFCSAVFTQPIMENTHGYPFSRSPLRDEFPRPFVSPPFWNGRKPRLNGPYPGTSMVTGWPVLL